MRISILILILLLSNTVSSQNKNKYKFIQRTTIDSLLKAKGFKDGDSVQIKVFFKVKNNGLIQILNIDAPDKILENKAIDALKKLEPFNSKYRNNSYKFTFDYKIKFSKIKYYEFNELNSELPEDDIWSLEIDKNGYKWIGTGKKGLVKMKNNDWIIFNKDNSIIKGLYISPIFCDSNNNIWLTFSEPDALIKFDGNNWKQLTKSITKLRHSPIKITEDNKGNLYFGGFNELVKFDKKKWSIITLPEGKFIIRAIAIDEDGTIAIGHNNGLIINKNGKWTIYQIEKDKLQSYVRSLKYLKKGKLFIGYGGNKEGGFSILENNNWKHYNTSNSNLSNNMVRDIEIDKNGNLWLATNNGLNKVKPNGKITPYYFFEGQNMNVIIDIAIEKNIIWVGTNSGLIKIEQ